MSEQANLIESLVPLARTLTESRTEDRREPRGTISRPASAKAVIAPGPSQNRPPHRNDDDDEEEGFFKRNRVLLIVGGLVVSGIVWLIMSPRGTSSTPVHKAPEPMTIKVQLPPPPPPPPPKLPPPPPKQEKAAEPAPMAKPEAAKPKPVEKPPEGLGTNNKGPGPGMAGLTNSGNGMIGGIGSGPGGTGSAAAWYAGKVQARIAEALRNNKKTRSAKLKVVVRVWPDATGRVARAQLAGSTGDLAMDATIQDEILSGLQLQEPPPQGMPLPISLRLTANRPQ